MSYKNILIGSYLLCNFYLNLIFIPFKISVKTY